jgi:UDP-N-acetylglucosamine/UDP-N-acetylgalactosamine diphosphorylase
MEAILAGMVEGVIVVDRQARLQLVNSAARQMLKLEEGDTAIGRPYIETVRMPAIAELVAAVLIGRVPDALQFSPHSAVLEVERAREFSPVKNPSGEDSPAQAQADISRLHARWLAAAGLEAPAALEIDPLFADDEPSLRARLPHAPRVVAGGHFYT